MLIGREMIKTNEKGNGGSILPGATSQESSVASVGLHIRERISINGIPRSAHDCCLLYRLRFDGNCPLKYVLPFLKAFRSGNLQRTVLPLHDIHVF